MPFKEILGQDRAKRILQGAIRNKRIPNAYLFCGPEGAGKELTAQAFVQALNCEKEGLEACGTCLSCRKIAHHNHPDLIVLSPSGTNLKIDQIRELRQLISFGPSEGSWLTSIILEADLMTQEAANSFLKALEEPPPQVLFILITSREEALPQTIISRCQKVLFTELPQELAIKIIKNKLGMDGEKAKRLARICGGGVGKIIEKIEDWDIAPQKVEELHKELKTLEKKDTVELLELAHLLSLETDQLEKFLSLALFWYWNLFLDQFKMGKTPKQHLRAIKIVMETLKSLNKRANIRLSLEVMFLRLRENYA